MARSQTGGISRPRKNGGTIIITRSGQVTERDAGGNLISRRTIPVNTANQIIRSGTSPTKITEITRSGKIVSITPTSPERAKALSIKESQQVKKQFARANLRGDIKKTSLGTYRATTSTGRKVLQRVSAIQNRPNNLSIKPSSRTPLYFEIGKKNIKPAILTRDKNGKFQPTDSELEADTVKNLETFSNVKIQKKLGIVKARKLKKEQEAFEKRYLKNFSPAEQKFLKQLEKYNKRNSDYEKFVNDFYSDHGLSITQGDKLLIKVLKGGSQLGFNIIQTPALLGGALDKALLSVQGLALKNFRRTTKNELKIAFKKVPSAVWSNFDPRKPENWVNILLILASVKAGAKPSKKINLNKKISISEANKIKVNPTSSLGKKIVNPKIKSLVGKVVENEVKILSVRISKNIKRLLKSLTPKNKNTLTVVIDGIEIIKPKLSVLNKLAKILRSLNKLLTKARTKAEIIKISAKIKILKRQLLKTSKKFRKKQVKTQKKIVRKAKFKKAIQKSQVVRTSKRLSRFIERKAFKLKVLKESSISKLENLKFRVLEQIKILKRAKDKTLLRAELRKIEVIIKYKKALLKAQKEINNFKRNKSRIINSELYKVSSSLKGKALSLTRSRIAIKIKIAFKRANNFIKRIVATYRKTKALAGIIRITLQLKRSQAMKQLKNFKFFDRKPTMKKAFKQKLKAKFKKEAFLKRQTKKNIRTRLKIKKRVAKLERKIKKTAKKKRLKVIRKAKFKKAIQKSQVVRTSKRLARSIRRSKNLIKISVKTRLLRLLRKRGVKLGTDQKRFKTIKKAPQTFIQSRDKVTAVKGNRQAIININNRGGITIYEEVRGSGGQVLIVELKTLSPPSIRTLGTVKGLNSYVGRITPIIISSLKPKSVSALDVGRKIKSRQSVTPKIKTNVRSKTSVKSRIKTSQRAGIRTSLAVKQAQTQAIKSRQRLQQKTSLQRKLKKIIPLKFKKKIKTDKEKKELIKWLKKQPKVYRPSLVAILFNITSYRIPKRITGLEIRPIIKRRPKSRRKRR